MLFLGVDPGLDGALVVINHEGHVDVVFDTPTQEIEKSSGGKKRVYLLPQIYEILRKIKQTAVETGEQIRIVGVEQTNAMPARNKDGTPRPGGAASMFSMGYGLAVWHMGLACVGLPMGSVVPRTWKAFFGISGSDKHASVFRCQQALPETVQYLTKVKHHNRAEAFLIAEYFRRRMMKEEDF